MWSATGLRRREFEVEGRGAKQHLIPYVRQLELANVPNEAWFIDPDVHCLLGGPFGVVHLPTNYGEVVMLI